MPDIKPNTLPLVSYLRERLTYDPKTGALRWRERPQSHFACEQAWSAWNIKYALMDAGTKSKGYLIVKMDGSAYSAHRIAWKLFSGEEPPPTIDHRDCNPANNIWENLRPATRSQQMWNARANRNNTLGKRGVYLHRSGRCVARINYKRVAYCLGLFDTIEEASAAYERAARELHGEFYREPKKWDQKLVV